CGLCPGTRLHHPSLAEPPPKKQGATPHGTAPSSSLLRRRPPGPTVPGPRRPSMAPGSDRHGLGVDAHLLAVLATPLKHHIAVDLGKQRIVLAQAHIDAGMDARPPLAHQDAACGDVLAAKPLDAQPLGNAVPAVLGAAAALLGGKQLQIHDESHRRLLPSLRDAHFATARSRPTRPGLLPRRPDAVPPPIAPALDRGIAAALLANPGPWSPARFGPEPLGPALHRPAGIPSTRRPASAARAAG